VHYLFSRAVTTLAVALLISSHVQAQFNQLLSRPAPDTAPAGGNGESANPIISFDGRFVVFASGADNLINTNGGGLLLPQFAQHLDVYLRDRNSGTTMLVSANTNGVRGNADSVPLAVSTNARYVLFESTAGDLVANDAIWTPTRSAPTAIMPSSPERENLATSFRPPQQLNHLTMGHDYVGVSLKGVEIVACKAFARF